MSKFRTSQKINVKTIVVGVVVAALIIAVFAGAMALSNKGGDVAEGYKSVKVSYSIGALDANGKYKESDSSLYTKDAFECEAGVKATLEFDSTIKYQIFFYDELDKFLSASETLDETDKTAAPEGAVYARIMITPVWDSETEEDDRVVTWLNQGDYTKQITISVEEIVEETTEDDAEA